MLVLKLKGEKVVGAYFDVSPTYQPKEDEVLVEALPKVVLQDNQMAVLYFRNNQVKYEIKEKGEL